MKKKIVSIAVMTMMTLALMPVIPVNALDITDTSYTLQNNVNEEIIVNSDNAVTLDLNGYKVEVTGASAIRNSGKGTLTIIDSKNTATVTALGGSYAAVATVPGSTTIINGGTYYSGSWYAIKNLGTMTIDGATVTKAKDVSSTAAVIDNGWYGTANDIGDANDTIDKDVFNETKYHTDPNDYTAVLTIKSGTVIGKASVSTTTVKNDDYGKLTISGGTFKDAGMAVQNNGTATINGGDFSSTGDTCIYNRKINDDGDKGELVINGGTITGKTNVLQVVGGASTLVYGGTFKGAILEQATSTASPVTEIYGGTFTSTAGTALDVSKYTKTNTTVDTKTGTVTTPTVAKITKYVFYKSYPSSAPFTYEVTQADKSKDGDTILMTGGYNSYYNEEVIRNGVDADKVKFTDTQKTTTSITFDVADFNEKKSASTLAANGITNAAADNFYASKEFSLDFSGVTFTKPGVFRYKVEETSLNKYFVASPVLYFDVWVVRKSKDPETDAYNEVTISSIVAHTAADTYETIADNYAVESKTGYLSSICSMKAMNLTVKHYSLGNQASRTADFKYTLTLSNVTKGSRITYVTSDDPKTEKYFEVSSDTGSASFDFNLKDKQAISFTNISEYPEYKIQSDETSLKSNSLQPVVKFENYQAIDSIIDSTTADTAKTTATYDGNTGETYDTAGTETSVGTANTVYGGLANSGLTTSNLNYSVTDTKETADTTVVFSVYKNGVIPTGIILDVAPYAVVLLAGFFGLIIFAAKRKGNAEDEA